MRIIVETILLILLKVTTSASDNNVTPDGVDNYHFEMLDLLDLGDHTHNQRFNRQTAIANSARKFLLEIYNEISEDQEPSEILHQRHRRSTNDDILISLRDRQEIKNCQTILTFASREGPKKSDNDMYISFNTNDVPSDLVLMHSVLRVYKQQSTLKGSQLHYNLTISVYKRIYNKHNAKSEYRILDSVNTTIDYKGWLEFKITQTLRNWLHYDSLAPIKNGRELRIEVTTTTTMANEHLNALECGLVLPQHRVCNMEPFIIGYFNGPELMMKIRKLHVKRDVKKRKRMAPSEPASSTGGTKNGTDIYAPPKACERLKFTVDFKDLQMHDWVIAPKKFEAYFCGGDCNFPLGTNMNATKHAIVQSLMHLKQPHLPKPCCVPTVLGAITILRYLNKDIIDLTKYHKAVAKECGCH